MQERTRLSWAVDMGTATLQSSNVAVPMSAEMEEQKVVLGQIGWSARCLQLGLASALRQHSDLILEHTSNPSPESGAFMSLLIFTCPHPRSQRFCTCCACDVHVC